MFFVFVYSAVAALGSGPFFAQGTDGTLSTRLYFSYVTLATLGYGDYTPAATSAARCRVEAILGPALPRHGDCAVRGPVLASSRRAPRPANSAGAGSQRREITTSLPTSATSIRQSVIDLGGAVGGTQMDARASRFSAAASPGSAPRAEPQGRRRRRRARRQARLPHVPAAAVPAARRACSRPPPSDIRCATSSTARTNATIHKTTVTGDRPRRARGAVRRAGAADLRLPRPRARRRGQLLRHRGRGGARVSRCTRCRDAVRLKEHVLGAWEAADQRSDARRRRRAERRRRRRRADRGRDAPARWPSSTAATSPRTTRTCRRTRPASPSSRPGPRSSRCSSRTSAPTRRRP